MRLSFKAEIAYSIKYYSIFNFSHLIIYLFILNNESYQINV